MCDNPFCLNKNPTDPYNWIYYMGQWYYALDYSSTVQMQRPVQRAVYSYKSNFYFCSDPAQCQGPPVSQASGPTNNGWLIANSSGQYSYGPMCPATGQNNQYVPMPDPNSGACEKTAANDKCANPCIRGSNGKLIVNANSGQCRVFPNVTEGGNAAFINNSCPTVCPSACVELWDSCPPGTGPLTTLAQTKSPSDLFSLTGPYRQDDTVNPLWPSNYVYNNPQNLTPIYGKPYTECYSYNTEFCDLPMGTQKTVITPTAPFFETQCFSSCPQGTFPDPMESTNCLFLPLDATSSSAITAETKVQKVFCNPQYFDPVYWPEPNAGQQKGCKARGLQSKQGSSCPQGTSPVVNEFFNLEWCMPDCPLGYFFDLTQSTCVANCQGTDAQSTYSTYLDYVDFYATSQRCLPGTNCIQNFTAGRCPTQSTSPQNSRVFVYSPESTNAEDVPIKANSVNTECPAKNARQGLGAQPKATQKMISDAQSMSSVNTNVLGECPTGMKFGASACNESGNLCYDECLPGYEPMSFCSNGQSTCGPENLIYACMALCPSHREGLGPWSELNNGQLYSCVYNYPGAVAPSDPNLWIQCPDDGRYTILQSTNSNDTTLSAAARIEPVCLRKYYLKRSTCPLGFTQVGSECISACSSSEVLIHLPNGDIVCQASNSQSSRHDMDIAALADSPNTKSEFKQHLLTRKAFSRGIGQDPNSGVGSSSDPVAWYYYVAGGVALAFFVWIFYNILKSLGI